MKKRSGSILLICFFYICSGCTTIGTIKESNVYKKMEQWFVSDTKIDEDWLIVRSEDKSPLSGYQLVMKHMQNNPDLKTFLEAKDRPPDFVKISSSSILNLAYVDKNILYEIDISTSSAKNINSYPVSKFPALSEKIKRFASMEDEKSDVSAKKIISDEQERKESNSILQESPAGSQSSQEQEVLETVQGEKNITEQGDSQEVQLMEKLPTQELGSTEPVIKMHSKLKGKPGKEVLEGSKAFIEVTIINSGGTLENFNVDLVSGDNKQSSSKIQSQTENVNSIAPNEIKKITFEVTCPNIINKIQKILVKISINHPDFGQLAYSQVSFKGIDREYRTYRTIKNTSNKNKQKELALAYLKSIDQKMVTGEFKKEVIRALDSIFLQKIQSSCNQKECGEYLQIFIKNKKDQNSKIIKKCKEINDFYTVKETDTYEGYKSFVQRYKNGACVEQIKERTTLKHWLNRPEDSNTLIQLGDIYEDLLSYNKAEEVFKKAIKIDGNNIQGYEKLGELLYSKIKDTDSAKKYLLKSEELKSKNYKIYYMLANIFSNLKSSSSRKILEYYGKAVKMNPGCAECRYFRAREYLPLLMRDKAIKDFQWIVENADKATFYYKSSKRHLSKLTGK